MRHFHVVSILNDHFYFVKKALMIPILPESWLVKNIEMHLGSPNGYCVHLIHAQVNQVVLP